MASGCGFFEFSGRHVDKPHYYYRKSPHILHEERLFHKQRLKEREIKLREDAITDELHCMPSEYIPLQDAARNLYEDLGEFDNQHKQILMAESGDTSPESVLQYFAITIAKKAQILGKKPPSDKLEKLNKQEMDDRGCVRIVDNNSAFWHYSKNRPEYVDLVVSKNDLPEILDWLKSQNRFG
jgi:hypothetical protein